MQLVYRVVSTVDQAECWVYVSAAKISMRFSPYLCPGEVAPSLIPDRVLFL